MLVIIIILILMKLSGIKLFYPTIISMFVWFYLVFAYLGVLPLYFHWDEYRYAIGVINQFQIIRLWIYSSGSILIIVFSIFFCRHILGLRINYKRNIEPAYNINIVLTILLMLCILVLFLYIRKIPAIPVIALIGGASSDEVKVLRSLATNDFGGGFHWYKLFFSSVLCFISFVSFSNYLVRRTFGNFVLLFVAFFVTSFAAVMTTEKAPIIWFSFGMVITYILTKKEKVNIKIFFLTGVFGLTLLVLMYRFFMGMEGRSVIAILQAIMSRTITGGITPAYFYLELFPEKQDYLLGASLPNPMGIFPWEHYRLTVEVMNYMFPDLSSKGIVGSAPTVFWGEMYANFGIGGIIISSVIVGILLYLLQYMLSKLKRNPITIGLSTFLIMELIKLADSGIGYLIFNINIFFICGLSLLMFFVEVNGPKKRIEVAYRKELVR